MLSYDQARQYAKAYVGALNTGRDAFEALFADDAEITVEGGFADLDDIEQMTPPGRSGYGGARLEPPEVVVIVKVRDAVGMEVVEHRATLDETGLITALRA